MTLATLALLALLAVPIIAGIFVVVLDFEPSDALFVAVGIVAIVALMLLIMLPIVTLARATA
ncbi:MAG TPA: hypothetical protein VFY14_15675 [Streptomyces sp.]|nr:hypothetical protein [Streptomyces sp.]